MEAGSELTLRVSDNCAGIAAKSPASRRSGLANLAERTAELGGKLVIGPAEGGGTQLDWQVPVS